jgi:hypothetical protein
MAKIIDPNNFGLPARTIIEELGKNHYALVVDRKSRVIMADGKKLVEKTDKIKKVLPGIKVSLKSTAPVCSKTIRFLADHGIELLPSV